MYYFSAFLFTPAKGKLRMMGAFTRKNLDVAAIFLTFFDHQFLNAFFSQFSSRFLSELVCIKKSKHFTPTQYTEYRKKVYRYGCSHAFYDDPHLGIMAKNGI